MPANTGIQMTDNVRHTVEKRYPGDKNRPDSGFRRKDGIRVDFQSTNSEPLGLEPRSFSLTQQAAGNLLHRA